MKHRVPLALIGLLALSLIACNVFSNLTGKVQETAEAAVTSVVATVAALPSATTQPSGGQPDIPKPEGGEGTVVRPPDGATMLLIPEGDFIMGADKAPALPNERPQRTVTLNAYWIDQTEVTNAQYRLCVNAGACTEPLSYSTSDYAAGYAGDDQPVVGVTWDMARTYCEWAGARLPTEAEWEKAARGTDGRPYPWGSERPDGSQANMSGEDDPYPQTAPVGSFPAGASPYGLLDMTGNAREWVADWYQEDYYASAPSVNPPGPDGAEMNRRVSRGGSFAEAEHHSRTSDRMPQQMDLQPQAVPFTLGFRCASTEPPTDASSGGDPGAQPAPTATTAAAAAPTATTAAEGSGEGGGEGEGTDGATIVTMAGLDELQSYRGDWTTRLIYPGEDGGTMEFTYKLEWTRDPPAQHVYMAMADSPFVEAIWAEGKVWVKAGDRWVLDEAPEAAQSFADFHEAFDVQDEMTFVGTETVNGIRCKHYVYDWASPDGKMKHHRELWVADDPSVPAVGIRVLFRMENSQTGSTVVSETEATLYDINQPFTIEPPN